MHDLEPLTTEYLAKSSQEELLKGELLQIKGGIISFYY